MWLIIGFFVILIIIFFFRSSLEHFNDTSGKFCNSCENKTLNQCTSCFNCGFCVDEWGNSGCIGGDRNGPFNKEKCKRWYYVDPFSYMIRNSPPYPCRRT